MTSSVVDIKNIIICDDNRDILEFMNYCLKSAGYAVSVTQNFNEISHKLKTVRPDLIILDIVMPEYDGFWIADELHSLGVYAPIIFMTAWDSPVNRMNAPVSGAVGYLIKPVDPDVLISLVKKSIGRPSDESNWDLKATRCN